MDVFDGLVIAFEVDFYGRNKNVVAYAGKFDCGISYGCSNCSYVFYVVLAYIITDEFDSIVL